MSERLPEKGREMRASDSGPWWLQPGVEIIGFEGDDEIDDDTGDDDTDDDEDVDDDTDEETSEDGDDEDDDEGSGSTKKTDKAKKAAPNIDALKSALRKERIARKAADKELKKLKATAPVKKAVPVKKVAPKKDGEAEETEPVEDHSAAIAEAERKATKMATRLREKAVDAVILRFAGDFQDPGDVLKLIDRKEIEVDQDDDDPSEIEVDEESVEDAVKALAKKKKHLLKSEEQRKTKSGSKMNGRRTKSTAPSDEALRKKYSALRR